MAYQQVGTPRFYVDNISWLMSLGVGVPEFEANNLYGFNASNPYKRIVTDADVNETAMYFRFDYKKDGIKIPMTIPYNFCAFLGHELSTTNTGTDDYNYITFDIVIPPTETENEQRISPTYSSDIPSINWNPSIEINSDISYDGFSIFNFQELLDEHYSTYIQVSEVVLDRNIQFGRFIAGKSYTLPHAPDLNLSLSYEYGTKTIETRGGASLSNSFYSKPPMWGNLAAWELGDGSENQNLGRNGRKIWDLSFSFLSQEDTFPKYDQLNMLATSTPAESQPDQYTLQGSNDFYTQVVRKTNGGQLPFIFQPDSEENSFAICKFDSKFAFQQTAPGLMSVRCKIREVW